MLYLLREALNTAGWLSLLASGTLFGLGTAGWGLYGYVEAYTLSGLSAVFTVFCFACRAEIQTLIDLDVKK